MSVSAPPWPARSRSSRRLHRVVVAAVVLSAGVPLVPVALQTLDASMPTRPTYDYDFTGDPTPLQDLAAPTGWTEVPDRPGCAEAAPDIRCFVTTLDRPEVLAYLHATVGTAAHDNNDGRLMPGWTSCGTSLGPAAVAFIRRDPTNAVRTAAGSWRFPKSGPRYGDRLSVGIMLVNAPHCASDSAGPESLS
jgi:hypothetical protein